MLGIGIYKMNSPYCMEYSKNLTLKLVQTQKIAYTLSHAYTVATQGSLNPCLLSLPTSLIHEISFFLTYFEFRWMFSILCQKMAQICFDKKYKHRMCKQQCMNVIKQTIIFPMRIDSNAKNILQRLYNQRKEKPIYRRFNFICESEDTFFHNISFSSMKKQILYLCKHSKRIASEAMTEIKLDAHMRQSKESNMRQIATSWFYDELNKIVRMSSNTNDQSDEKYHMFLSWLDLLFYAKSKQIWMFDCCIFAVLRRITQEYKCFGIYRYILIEYDAHYDWCNRQNAQCTHTMANVEKKEISEINSCGEDEHIRTRAQDYYSYKREMCLWALPIYHFLQDYARHRMSLKFAKESVYWTLFGSKNANSYCSSDDRMTMKIKIENFTGLSVHGIRYRTNPVVYLEGGSHVLYLTQKLFDLYLPRITNPTYTPHKKPII
jgi:hypothetical protein